MCALYHKHNHLCSCLIWRGPKINKHSFREMKESRSDCEGGGEGREGVLIRSGPNYVGEIELHIGRGRVRAPPTDTKTCLQIAG